jgi:hypothetical protein
MARFAALVLGIVIAITGWMGWPKSGSALIAGVTAPDVNGRNWLNSQPLTIGALKGRVVLIDFWTYG